jgi:hypothetical protein
MEFIAEEVPDHLADVAMASAPAQCQSLSLGQRTEDVIGRRQVQSSAWRAAEVRKWWTCR